MWERRGEGGGGGHVNGQPAESLGVRETVSGPSVGWGPAMWMSGGPSVGVGGAVGGCRWGCRWMSVGMSVGVRAAARLWHWLVLLRRATVAFRIWLEPKFATSDSFLVSAHRRQPGSDLASGPKVPGRPSRDESRASQVSGSRPTEMSPEPPGSQVPASRPRGKSVDADSETFS